MTRKLLSLLFFAVILIGAAGCFEEKKPEQNQETFVPVEPGVRLQRFCQILCINTEDGELTPLEQLQDNLRLQEKLKPNEKLSEDSINTLAKAVDDQKVDKNALPATVEKFKNLHQDVPAPVVEAMKNANIRNLSVFLSIIDSNYYAIRTFEYIGEKNNFEQDWRNLTRNSDFIEWNNSCEECLIPIVGKSVEGGQIQWMLPGEEIMYLPLANTEEKKEE